MRPEIEKIIEIKKGENIIYSIRSSMKFNEKQNLKGIIYDSLRIKIYHLYELWWTQQDK